MNDNNDIKMARIFSIAIAVPLLVMFLAIRSCVLETSQINAGLQAKCIEAGGIWELVRGSSIDRCVLVREVAR